MTLGGGGKLSKISGAIILQIQLKSLKQKTQDMKAMNAKLERETVDLKGLLSEEKELHAATRQKWIAGER